MTVDIAINRQGRTAVEPLLEAVLLYVLNIVKPTALLHILCPIFYIRWDDCCALRANCYDIYEGDRVIARGTCSAHWWRR